jgi:Resolvase, N terminal domain
LEHYTLR